MARQERRLTRVFHATGDTFKLVAEVDTVNLEMAFRLTNHAERDWTHNKGVRAVANPCRSTSVGDVIVTPDGEAFMVLSIGFRTLGEV